MTKGWFALLESVLIASGISRKQVEAIADELVPNDKRDLVYVFQVRGRK